MFVSRVCTTPVDHDLRPDLVRETQEATLHQATLALPYRKCGHLMVFSHLNEAGCPVFVHGTYDCPIEEDKPINYPHPNKASRRPTPYGKHSRPMNKAMQTEAISEIVLPTIASLPQAPPPTPEQERKPFMT